MTCYALMVAALSVAAAGCSADEESGDVVGDRPDAGLEDPSMPALVNVDLIGAVIAPGLVDGTEWDGIGTVEQEVLQEVAEVLAGTSPYAAILAVFGGPLLSAFDPPDPFGLADIAPNGVFDPELRIPLASIDTNTEDTFTPEWGFPAPGWINVPFDDSVRIRVSLTDEDLANHDVIGSVELNFADLRAAYEAQMIHPVRVDDQNPQILFVTISVTESQRAAARASGSQGIRAGYR